MCLCFFSFCLMLFWFACLKCHWTELKTVILNSPTLWSPPRCCWRLLRGRLTSSCGPKRLLKPAGTLCSCAWKVTALQQALFSRFMCFCNKLQNLLLIVRETITLLLGNDCRTTCTPWTRQKWMHFIYSYVSMFTYLSVFISHSPHGEHWKSFCCRVFILSSDLLLHPHFNCVHACFNQVSLCGGVCQ